MPVATKMARFFGWKVEETNKLNEMFWSFVAVMNEKLLLRGVDHLYCIAP